MDDAESAAPVEALLTIVLLELADMALKASLPEPEKSAAQRGLAKRATQPPPDALPPLNSPVNSIMENVLIRTAVYRELFEVFSQRHKAAGEALAAFVSVRLERLVAQLNAALARPDIWQSLPRPAGNSPPAAQLTRSTRPVRGPNPAGLSSPAAGSLALT